MPTQPPIPVALWGKPPATDKVKRPAVEYIDALTPEDREDGFSFDDLKAEHHAEAKKAHDAAEKERCASSGDPESKPDPYIAWAYEKREGYSVIVLDPPWLERGGGKSKRGADRHYPLVPTPQLPTVILGSGVFVPAKSCHMYMWATNNFLDDAIWLMGTLGFTYITNVPWIKLINEKGAMKKIAAVIEAEGTPSEIVGSLVSMGLGQYFRGASELLLIGEFDPHSIVLFGRKGSGAEVRTDRKDLPGVILAPKREHSRKPAIAYELFEDRSSGPKLEMFSREARKGWDAWGNQTDKFDGGNE